MIDMLNLIAFVIFVLVIAGLIIKDRKNIDLEGIMVIRRTKKGRKFIDGLAKSHPRFWNVMSYIGVAGAVPAMIIALFFIVNSALNVSTGAGSGVKLVLPWVSPTTKMTPGFLFVPWYFWVIGVLTVVIPHEFFHGIISRLEKINVKSIGWVLFLFLPGAFVEPNEKKLKKSGPRTKLKIYAAGSYANFLMGGLFFVLSLLLVSLFFVPGGVIPSGYIKDFPVDKANASGALTGINDKVIRNVGDISNILDGIEPNTTITLRTTSGNYTIKTAKHPELNRSFIGIKGPYSKYLKAKAHGDAMGFVRQLFGWIVLLNLGVGLVNLLPIKPLDGGLIFETVVETLTNKSKHIVRGTSLIVLFILLFSIFGGFFL